MTASISPRNLFGRFAGGNGVFVGIVRGDRVIETDAASSLELIQKGAKATDAEHRLKDLKVLTPVDRPSKIVCVGLNYRSHIREMKAGFPKVPLIFSKPSSAIIGPGEDIVLPPASSRVDYEGECAIVIGSRASHVKDGLRCVFGYTCLNDVTARDLQKSDADWTRAKGFDTFCPIGPFVSTSAPTRVTTRLNGRTVQDCALADRVYDDAALVEYISSVMTLEPGDIIATGTPSGISPMKAGDVVEVELDGIGCLTNRVVKAQ
jgi:2-keto-4-pentenoate hydratase/2-oxohepta-3-ene-1,7-dioic acid hydratase in catechol pathway